MRPKKKEHFTPHARKISSVAKLIMVMNSVSKKERLLSQTAAIKDGKNNSNHDREDLLEESEMNHDLDNREKMLMRLKFSDLPFCLRNHFQKNNIP